VLANDGLFPVLLKKDSDRRNPNNWRPNIIIPAQGGKKTSVKCDVYLCDYTMRLAEYLLMADAQIDCYTMQRGGRLYHFGIGGSL